jgi:hypothetical protein
MIYFGQLGSQSIEPAFQCSHRLMQVQQGVVVYLIARLVRTGKDVNIKWDSAKRVSTKDNGNI